MKTRVILGIGLLVEVVLILSTPLYGDFGLLIGLGLFFIIGCVLAFLIILKLCDSTENWYAKRGKPLKHPWQ